MSKKAFNSKKLSYFKKQQIANSLLRQITENALSQPIAKTTVVNVVNKKK